jgi:hypothetical protein
MMRAPIGGEDAAAPEGARLAGRSAEPRNGASGAGTSAARKSPEAVRQYYPGRRGCVRAPTADKGIA